MYFNRRLVEANIKKDSAPLREVRRMLAELRSSWVQIVGKGETSPDGAGSTGVNIAG